eukprot:GHVS01006294.1.p1 GENE.GHVS01006294.1~~GHVS01006294.1.p1  ORF type:complete len:105 (-),score=3.78 GHVS01006294.1:64-378(-)
MFCFSPKAAQNASAILPFVLLCAPVGPWLLQYKYILYPPLSLLQNFPKINIAAPVGEPLSTLSTSTGKLSFFNIRRNFFVFSIILLIGTTPNLSPSAIVSGPYQ